MTISACAGTGMSVFSDLTTSSALPRMPPAIASSSAGFGSAPKPRGATRVPLMNQTTGSCPSTIEYFIVFSPRSRARIRNL